MGRAIRLRSKSAGLASPSILVWVGWALAHLQDRCSSLEFALNCDDSDGGLKPTLRFHTVRFIPFAEGRTDAPQVRVAVEGRATTDARVRRRPSAHRGPAIPDRRQFCRAGERPLRLRGLASLRFLWADLQDLRSNRAALRLCVAAPLRFLP